MQPDRVVPDVQAMTVSRVVTVLTFTERLTSGTKFANLYASAAR